MKIINIAGVNLRVSKDDYQYYWSQRNIGPETDAFKTACRRLLGLGPNDHHLNTNYVKNKVWGDKEKCIDMILNSGLVEYVEDWCKSSANQDLQGAAMSHYKEKQLELGLDPEFEDELHL